MTSQILEDAAGLAAFLRAVVPSRMAFRVDDWLLNADGVAKPLGLMKRGRRAHADEEAAQPAATINLANTQKMLTRLPAASRQAAVWLAHPETEPQLSALGFPHWNPSGPIPPLHGLPVLFKEACAPLGTEGDLILVDPAAIFTATRDPAVREDVSLHVWFDYDAVAFRFTMRLGGMPLWRAPITRFRMATTVSTVVTLETR